MLAGSDGEQHVYIIVSSGALYGNWSSDRHTYSNLISSLCVCPYDVPM